MDVGRRGLFQLVGMTVTGGIVAAIIKVLPKKPVKPFIMGEIVTQARLNELVERVNHG